MHNIHFYDVFFTAERATKWFLRGRVSGIINLIGKCRVVFCPQHKVKSGQLGNYAVPLSGMNY